MIKKKKFYVVWKGVNTGIFNSWDECKKNIHNYSGAKYKSFENIDLAKKAFNTNYRDFIGKSKDFLFVPKNTEKIILNSISVDASCSGNPGKMEYQGVETSSKKVLFRIGVFEDGTNNIGEFLALIHALALMTKNKDNRPIYTDSKIAMAWIKVKKCRTKNPITQKNKELYELIKRGEGWLQKNSFPNKILKWETKDWGEIPADFGRK